MTTQKTFAPAKSAPAPLDAVALLNADHEAVEQLFADYEKACSVPSKKALVAQICTALSVHAQIEEEIYYPAVKAALKSKLLLPEAKVERAGLNHLIAQLQGAEPNGEVYEAKIKLLSEYVKHHVEEKHNEVFPKLKALSLDMDELGARMAARKDDLLARAA